MVSDQQVRRLMRLMKSKSTKAIAALKAGMDESLPRTVKKKARKPCLTYDGCLGALKATMTISG